MVQFHRSDGAERQSDRSPLAPLYAISIRNCSESHRRRLRAGLELLTTGLLAYFRSQINFGLRWTLRPLTERFPWNSNAAFARANQRLALISLLTTVDLTISEDNSVAIYRKSSDYEVRNGALVEYREAVTATGTAAGFSTLIGRIVETIREHGFYISRIDLGDVLRRGARFRNIYTAYLFDSFVSSQEHWTQEIAVPTSRLTLRIIFPKNRPPTLLRCKIIAGLIVTQIATAARLTQLHGCPTAIWDISDPPLDKIYKLEWCW